MVDRMSESAERWGGVVNTTEGNIGRVDWIAGVEATYQRARYIVDRLEAVRTRVEVVLAVGDHRTTHGVVDAGPVRDDVIAGDDADPPRAHDRTRAVVERSGQHRLGSRVAGRLVLAADDRLGDAAAHEHELLHARRVVRPRHPHVRAARRGRDAARVAGAGRGEHRLRRRRARGVAERDVERELERGLVGGVGRGELGIRAVATSGHVPSARSLPMQRYTVRSRPVIATTSDGRPGTASTSLPNVATVRRLPDRASTTDSSRSWVVAPPS
jgi:hypothetical protein